MNKREFIVEVLINSIGIVPIRKAKIGDKILFKRDLKVGEIYGVFTFFGVMDSAIENISYIGTIKEIKGATFLIEESRYSFHIAMAE